MHAGANEQQLLLLQPTHRVSMIISRPKEVTEEEISRHGSAPTVAPVKPAGRGGQQLGRQLGGCQSSGGRLPDSLLNVHSLQSLPHAVTVHSRSTSYHTAPPQPMPRTVHRVGRHLERQLAPVEHGLEEGVGRLAHVLPGPATRKWVGWVTYEQGAGG